MDGHAMNVAALREVLGNKSAASLTLSGKRVLLYPQRVDRRFRRFGSRGSAR
jgi:antitoxin component HigA of HigAB toxin-antitoxin module